MDFIFNSADTLAAVMVAAYTIGGFIHILLVIAVTILNIRLIQERKVMNYY
ncbi:MAG TPA: DUF5670 family protein [Ignavibacteriaceae bacterium]|nr:DUF5670 family protein [Ignavibacteriaceae bacterium]